MLRFFIRVNTGGEDKINTIKYEFVHKQWNELSEEEQSAKWDEAVKALNTYYKKYGRFGTQVGVSRFFADYGFERSKS